MRGIKAEEMPLVVMMDIKLQLILPFHSARDGKSKATENNSPRDPLLIVWIVLSEQQAEEPSALLCSQEKALLP